jgi:glycosyltransferase involved in cell wall biosynthesis
VGSQARDYRILMDAMRDLPGIKLIVVATPASVADIHIPSNVEMRFHVPLGEVHDIIAHSRFMVLPLAGSQVPCGHVTIVSAMHLGKAVVATRSVGIIDYIKDEISGRLVIPKDSDDLADKIGTLYRDPIETMRLGDEGQRFAKSFCVEQNAVNYFQAVLRDFSPAASRN